MAGVVALTKFNPSKQEQIRNRRTMGPDGRYYFKGRPLYPRVKPKSPLNVEETVSFKIGHTRLNEPRKGITHTKKYKLQDLIVAIREVEDAIAIDPENTTEDDLLIHFVRRAFKSDSVLKDIMKKLLPDLKHVEADIDVNEQFQLIIDATGNDEDDDIVDVKALPAPNISNHPKRRGVKIRRRRKKVNA